MFMIFNIILFKSTGFNLKDIPYNADIITNSYQPHSFDAVWLLQNKGIGKVRITATWDEVDGADYCVIQKPGVDVWYFINSIKMLNENCCELALTMDALTTIGLEKITELSGWCIRKHPKTDNLFENVREEDWTPTEELVIDTGQEVNLSAGEATPINLIACTFNLTGDYSKAKAFEAVIEGSEESYKVAVPLCPDFDNDSDSETEVKMVFPDNTQKSYKIPATRLWWYVSTLKNQVNIARSLSLENGIVGCYVIPPNFCKNVSLGSKGYESIRNEAGYVELPSVMNYEYFNGILNKKVFALFNQYILSSICSGDSKIYEAKDVFHAGDSAPKIGVWADVSPSGQPYFRPEYFHGNNTDFFMECVKGSQWQNTPIAFNTASGSAFNSLDYLNQREMEFLNIFDSTLSGIATTTLAAKSMDTKSLITAGLGASSLGQNIVNYGFDYKKKERDFSRQNSIVAPEIRFPRSQSIQNFVGNSAWIYRRRLSLNDAKRLDKYFSMYGYAVDEALTPEVFHTRQNFNYVQCEDITIKANQSLWIRQIAEAQLSNGVRIWHTAFNPALYTQANPAV